MRHVLDLAEDSLFKAALKRSEQDNVDLGTIEDDAYDQWQDEQMESENEQ